MQLQYLSVSSPANRSTAPVRFQASTSTASNVSAPHGPVEANAPTLTLCPPTTTSPPSLLAPPHADEDPPSGPPPPLPKKDPPVFLHARFPSITWREPPNREYFITVLLGRDGPISSFHRARVTVSADWAGEGDQGGLLLWLPWNSSTSRTRRRWFKAGIQLVDGRACESVVATDDWSDWSCAPVRDDVGKGLGGGAKITLEIERDREGAGERWRSGVSVYVVEARGRRKIRQCTWLLDGVDESERMLVAMYANKPSRDEREELLVQFEDFVITKREAA